MVGPGKRRSARRVMEDRFTKLFPYLAGRQLQPGRPRTAGPGNDFAAGRARPEAGPDPEENRGVPAAYTYLGQFTDHDLTFDPISHLREALTRDQLQALVDFRTPRFDLDNLYGRGPDDQPYMYETDGIHMLLGESMSGNPFDPGAVQLPRGPNGRALIGDPRNDENRIVAQLHAIFLRFHNQGRPSTGREEAHQLPGSPPASPMALPVGPGQRLPAQNRARADVPECLSGSLRACSDDTQAPGRWPGAHARGVFGGRLPLRALDDPPAVPAQPDDRAAHLLRPPPPTPLIWGDSAPSRPTGPSTGSSSSTSTTRPGQRPGINCLARSCASRSCPTRSIPLWRPRSATCPPRSPRIHRAWPCATSNAASPSNCLLGSRWPGHSVCSRSRTTNS